MDYSCEITCANCDIIVAYTNIKSTIRALCCDCKEQQEADDES